MEAEISGVFLLELLEILEVPQIEFIIIATELQIHHCIVCFNFLLVFLNLFLNLHL